jgi:hypothetical protein
VKTKNVKAIYEGLADGLSADMRREAYRLVGAGREQSTSEWQRAAARQLRADRYMVDSNVLSFAAHAHRKAFIKSQGQEGLESIAKRAKASCRGFSNLAKLGLNRAEIFLAIREARKNLEAKADKEAEERQLDREQLHIELEQLMEKVSDPELRALGAERLADEIVEALHRVAGAVSHRAGRGFNSKELPTPGTKAFRESKKLLVWVYELLAELSDSDRGAYVQTWRLWKILTDALRQREIRKQSMSALMRLGIMPVKGDFKQMDWLGLGNAPAGLAPDVAAELFSLSINCDLAIELAA